MIGAWVFAGFQKGFSNALGVIHGLKGGSVSW
jgi:hypothetical protein